MALGVSSLPKGSLYFRVFLRLHRRVFVGIYTAYGSRSGRDQPLPGLVPARVGEDLVQLRHGSVAEGFCGRQQPQRNGINGLGSDGEEPLTSVRPRR